MWLEGEVRGDRTQSQEPRIDSLVANAMWVSMIANIYLMLEYIVANNTVFQVKNMITNLKLVKDQVNSVTSEHFLTPN